MLIKDFVNPHLAAKSETPAFTPKPPRKITRSPQEELMSRIAATGQTEKIPDGLAAIILSRDLEETVKPDGITFRYKNQKYHFYSADSITCHPSNVGRKALFVFNPHAMDAIYILDLASKKFIEAVPIATHPEWFSEKEKQTLKECRRVAEHVHQELKKSHRLTTSESAERALENCEKIQYANEFPLPEPERQKRDTATLPEPSRIADEMNRLNECAIESQRTQKTVDSDLETYRRNAGADLNFERAVPVFNENDW